MTFKYVFHTGWNTSKTTSGPISLTLALQKNLNEDSHILSAAKCRSMILVSRNIRCMQTFAGSCCALRRSAWRWLSQITTRVGSLGCAWLYSVHRDCPPRVLFIITIRLHWLWIMMTVATETDYVTYLSALNMRSDDWLFLVYLGPVTFWEIIYCSLQRTTRKLWFVEKPHDAVVKFDTYRNLQRHRAVSLPQHGFLVGICLQCRLQ